MYNGKVGFVSSAQNAMFTAASNMHIACSKLA
jgi:hypothetical protein